MIETVGLRELARNARKLGDSGITDGLKKANIDAATVVVQRGQAIANATGLPAVKRAATSLRATKTAGKAGVTLGRNNIAWYMGNNFGTKGRFPQFPPAGTTEFLYRAIGEEGERIREVFADGIEQIVTRGL